jgi:hypothetical protein
VEEFGLTLFNMSDIIREALAYVMKPEVKEEVVDPKAKGGKGAKADATQAVDVFSGLDTVQYKEISGKLLQ